GCGSAPAATSSTPAAGSCPCSRRAGARCIARACRTPGDDHHHDSNDDDHPHHDRQAHDHNGEGFGEEKEGQVDDTAARDRSLGPERDRALALPQPGAEGVPEVYSVREIAGPDWANPFRRVRPYLSAHLEVLAESRGASTAPDSFRGKTR